MRWSWMVAALALAACGGDADVEQAPTVDPTAAAVALLTGSPCDGTAPSVLADSTVARALTGATRLDPEVGDCQRLVGADGEFGPLVALYPVDATLGLAAADFATARPAVAVYSWGAAGGPYADGYPELGLAGQGTSCLWVRSAGADAWSGALVHGAFCGAATPPPDADFTLPVFARAIPGTVAADYPRTARWEWDLDGRRHAIGFKCGDGWCTAVGGGAAPRTQPLMGGDDTPRERVPGWSDAQHLAVYDSAAGEGPPRALGVARRVSRHRGRGARLDRGTPGRAHHGVRRGRRVRGAVLSPAGERVGARRRDPALPGDAGRGLAPAGPHAAPAGDAHPVHADAGPCAAGHGPVALGRARRDDLELLPERELLGGAVSYSTAQIRHFR